MNWFLVKLVYRIQCGSGEHSAQFEEQLRLINAESAADAMAKAQQIGEAESSGVETVMSSIVQWKFINVSEIYRLNQFIDGAEIHSSLKEQENGALYEQMTHKRAASLRRNIEHHLLDIF